MNIERKNKTYTVEEYLKHEWTAEVRSEFINGQLIEMPGEKDINNEIAGNIYFLLFSMLKAFGFSIYSHDVKVKIFGENKYYYPDVFATKEPKIESNKYIKFEPAIIFEVVSETSHTAEYVDKYIAYTKIPSLLYYLIVEPEIPFITCHIKGENGEWTTSKFTNLDEVVNLDALSLSFRLKQVYM